MSVVNFALSKPLEVKINKVIKKEGFASKAEFFRFAAMEYIKNFLVEDDISQEEFEASARAFGQKLEKYTKNKKFPSVREQLADLR